MTHKVKYIDCKDGVNLEDFLYMTPYIAKILAAFSLYCVQNGLPCRITSIMGDAPGRVSKTHETGRAFDASVFGWPEFHIHRIVHKFNKEFKDIAAFSASDNKPRAVIYHKVDGGAYHLHFQTKRL